MGRLGGLDGWRLGKGDGEGGAKQKNKEGSEMLKFRFPLPYLCG